MEHVLVSAARCVLSREDGCTIVCTFNTLKVVWIAQTEICFWICSCVFLRVCVWPAADIDECRDGTHQCRYNQICENTRGSYHCTCPRGYRSQGVGRPCVGTFPLLWSASHGLNTFSHLGTKDFMFHFQMNSVEPLFTACEAVKKGIFFCAAPLLRLSPACLLVLPSCLHSLCPLTHSSSLKSVSVCWDALLAYVIKTRSN